MDQDFITSGLMTVMPVVSLRLPVVVSVLGSEELLHCNKKKVVPRHTNYCSQHVDVIESTLFEDF